MKAGKTAGSSGIVTEMIKAVRDQFIDYLTPLFNQILYEGVVPTEWHLSHIINLFKRKGDALINKK